MEGLSLVVDCFPFSNEIDLLAVRLKMLNEIVDVFLIQEVAETHSGKPKPLRLSLDDPALSSYREKIVLIQRPAFPSGLQPFERDWWQRDTAVDWLESNLGPKDVLIYGDVDEIPSVTGLLEAITLVTSGKSPVAFLAMKMHYCYLNYQESSNRLMSNLGEFTGVKKRERSWIGTSVSSWNWAQRFLPSQLRGRAHVNLEDGVRIANGGWHLSYVDGLARSGFLRFKEKLESSAHQEFNSESLLSKFERRVSRGQDPLGRRFVRFKRLPDLSGLPAELRQLAAVRPDMILQ